MIFEPKNIYFTSAKKIVQDGVSLVIGESMPIDFQLLEGNIDHAVLYKTLLNKAVETVLQDYFTNFPLHLQKIEEVDCYESTEYPGVYRVPLPKGVHIILKIKNLRTQNIVKKEYDFDKFLHSKEFCYCYNEYKGLFCSNVWIGAPSLRIYYIHNLLYIHEGNEYNSELKHGNDLIILDKNLLLYAFCKDLSISQSAPISKTEYFANEYRSRLNYLINKDKYDTQIVFDLCTKSKRLAKL